MRKLAIIGAGIAGLTLARLLHGRADVTVLEKSRGLGGRMATRRAGRFEFDHGAQYFTARSREFQRFIQQHSDTGIVQDWQPRTLTLGNTEKPYNRPWFEPHWVGVPAMNNLGKALADGQRVDLEAQVERIESTESGWTVVLQDGSNRGVFDWVVCTAPAAQCRQLLPGSFQHHQALRKVRMSGCFTLMLGFNTDPGLPFQAAKIKDPALGWVAVNSSKPRRGRGFSLLAQSTNDWADTHMELPLPVIQQQMMDTLTALFPTLPTPDHVDIHRWRYAATTVPLEQDFLLDRHNGLAACGDWCLGGRVEAAFTSAFRLAEALQPELG